uniref:Transposase n=1 Tax=Meloidogyne chitwoodi TaxID=59747 RepID=Q869A8_MELCH|nr:transposase [Meloidogyne chitwoodi]
MDEKKRIRERLLHEFQLGHTAAEAARNIKKALGDNALDESTARRWFTKFRTGDFSTDDGFRSGRPSTFETEPLRAAINENPATSTRKLAEELGSSKDTVWRNMKEMELSYRSGRTVPHDLNEQKRQKRVEICRTLLQRQQTSPFLDQILTCDESWILYDNRASEKQWLAVGQDANATPKQLHPKKQLLSVWWCVHGIVYWELLPLNRTITSEVYCEQLHRVQQQLRRPPYTVWARKGILFQQDGARPHVSAVTRKKIEDLGWDILEHSPYSPDLAPSDYYLFSPLKDFLRGKQFSNEEEICTALKNFFDSKGPEWYRKGIEKLPNLWERCIQCNGNYFYE